MGQIVIDIPSKAKRRYADNPHPIGYKDLVGFKNFYRVRVGEY